MRARLGSAFSKHEIVGSTYQMAVLLQFNDYEVLSYEELLEILNGTDSEISRHVLGIVKAGILCKSTKGKELTA